MRTITVHRLGRRRYGAVHDLQKRLVEARSRGEIGDVLLCVEHEPVITLGRGGNRANLRRSEAELRSLGVEVEPVGRGGDVTYHGPGQLVMYPILDLKPDRKDVRKYVASLEETMIRTATDYGLIAGRISGLNGAWIEDRKVGAVGVRISRWVTMHGLALNVSTPLVQFDLIVPCGISDKGVTSLEAELGRPVSFDEVTEAAVRHFAALHESRATWRDGAPALEEVRAST
ncbi:MAG: lipoyl(octanoyl) transferase LipB [Myxococcota bacterium]